MSKAATISVPFVEAIASPPKTISKPSDRSDFVPVALFSGIGLLASLIAVLSGVQGVWY